MPTDFWLVAPRSDTHASGGWYFELPPGRPRRHPPTGPGLKALPRRPGEERGRGGLGSSGGAGAADGDGAPPKPRRCAPLPPAVALITTAFRALDRERGAEHGMRGALSRAWSWLSTPGGLAFKW